MTIFGFNIGKKQLIIGGVVIALIFGANKVSDIKRQKEIEERRLENEAKKNKEAENVDPNAGLSREEIKQKGYIEAWGEPPEGFRWNNKGELVAVSSDDLTAEDVLWSYLRALSILDFSTAQKYSSVSLVKSTYENYFSDSKLGSSSYYMQFLRKAFKLALTSLEVESVGDAAVFADGTSIVTAKIKVLDLTDKDFWQVDRDEIFDHLSTLYTDETDSTKAEQFVYDYIYSAYEDGKVGKRELTLEFKLDKINLGGWLISDDTDLNSALRYEDGTQVAEYIFDEFTEWSRDQRNKMRGK